MELLDTLELRPPSGASGTVILLHGLGASADDLAPIIPLLQLPNIRFVLPDAPQRPVTINGGYVMPAWYDILTLGEARGEDQASVRESAETIRALIEREEASGIPPSQVVLAGFSQGAALALHVGTRYSETLRGIAVLSGYEVLEDSREKESAPQNRSTPILFCHGTADPMVTIARGRAAHAAYAGPGRIWHEFPMGHEICEDELDVLREWLGARFS